MPPEAASVADQGELTCPFGRVDVVMASVAGGGDATDPPEQPDVVKIATHISAKKTCLPGNSNIRQTSILLPPRRFCDPPAQDTIGPPDRFGHPVRTVQGLSDWLGSADLDAAKIEVQDIAKGSVIVTPVIRLASLNSFGSPGLGRLLSARAIQNERLLGGTLDFHAEHSLPRLAGRTRHGDRMRSAHFLSDACLRIKFLKLVENNRNLPLVVGRSRKH